jgi:hypothetical protein
MLCIHVNPCFSTSFSAREGDRTDGGGGEGGGTKIEQNKSCASTDYLLLCKNIARPEATVLKNVKNSDFQRNRLRSRVLTLGILNVFRASKSLII